MLEECGLVWCQLFMVIYSFGYCVLILGIVVQGQLSLVSVVCDIFQDIGNECNESVLVRVCDGMDMVCVVWWDVLYVIWVYSQLGDCCFLFVGVFGKFLLVYVLVDVQVEIFFGKLEKFILNIIIKQIDFKKEFKKILVEGFSIFYFEKMVDMVVVVVLVCDF